MKVIRRDGSAGQVLLSMNAYRGDKGRIERSVCLIDQPISVNVEQPVTVRRRPALQGRLRAVPCTAWRWSAPTGEISLANAAFWSLMGREPSAGRLRRD